MFYCPTESEPTSAAMLARFSSSLSGPVGLRNTADMAALLVADLSGCGAAYTDTTASCFTLSVTKKAA